MLLFSLHCWHNVLTLDHLPEFPPDADGILLQPCSPRPIDPQSHSEVHVFSFVFTSTGRESYRICDLWVLSSLILAGPSRSHACFAGKGGVLYAWTLCTWHFSYSPSSLAALIYGKIQPSSDTVILTTAVADITLWYTLRNIYTTGWVELTYWAYRMTNLHILLKVIHIQYLRNNPRRMYWPGKA